MQTVSSRISLVCLMAGLCLMLVSGAASAQGTWLDNNWGWDTSSLNPNVNSRSSDHFKIMWGIADRADGNNGNFPQVNEQLAQGNLQMLEIQWRILHDPIASGGMGIQAPAQSANPAYWDGNSYRDTLCMNGTGLWGGGAWGGADGHGFPIFGLPPSYLRFDPPSGATPHEYGHTVFITAGGFNNTPYDGMWHEAMANWLELQIDNDYPPVGNTVYNHTCSLPHGRDYYDAWPLLEYFKDEDRWGSSFINTVMTQGRGYESEYIFDAMARLDTSGAVDKLNDIKDALGDCHAHCLTWDFQRKQLFKTQAPLTSDFYSDYYRRGFSELEKRPGSVASGNQSAWYRIPWGDAPSQGGFDFIPIALTGKSGGGYQVGVNFQPLWDGTRASDWRATLVAVNTNGEPRYSKAWNGGINYITLSTDENSLYLVVAATPKMLGFNGFERPLVMDPILQPQAFEIAFVDTQAGPYESNPAATQSHSGMTQHANGGGWKATTATVDATAYLGPNTLILNSAQVRGNARIEDYAVVRNNAQVRDNAVLSGHALISDSAQVYGNASVRDWGCVKGNAKVYDYGRVCERAMIWDSCQVHTNATVKGAACDYSVANIDGYAIVDGDAGNYANIDHGVLTCWAWGIDQSFADGRPDIGSRYCEYTFETYSPIFAKDTYGITHGYLMGGATKPTTVDSGNTARIKALALNGTDQYVELHKDVCDFVDCTISTWVKWNGGSSDQVILSMGDGANKYMTLTAKGSTSQLRFAITNSGSGGETALTSSDISASAWTHIAITFSSGTVTLYVNGASAASGAFTLRPCDLMGPNTVNGGNCNYLGKGASGNYFAGQIDLFAVYVKALSASEIATIAANTGSTTSIPPQTDVTAPTPNAPTWLQSPTALDEASIQMSSNVGADASGFVEYYFTCTSGGGHNSGWISSNRYTDCNLTPGTSCTYTVKMRDKWGNTTSTSTPATVSTTADSGAPTPNPATFAYGPIGASTTSITMTATKGACSGGLVEYNFTKVSGTGGASSSGWQSSPTWTATGLTSTQSYSYTVQMRDVRGITGTASSVSTAIQPTDKTIPTLYALGEWVMRPYATMDNNSTNNCVSMTARSITDTGGVQYSFECTSGGGPSSGWQSSNTYKTSAQPDGTYTYRFRVRQTNATANVSAYSQSWNATINPTTGYHTCTIAQLLATLQDHYLASFNGTVMRVNVDNYDIKDLSSGATIKVKPNAVACATNPALAMKNVSVKGHLFTYTGTKWVTYATVTSTGDPTLYTISGRVTNLGVGVAGATVYFSDVANASVTYIVTATTDANGYYTRTVMPGTWYVAAKVPDYYPSADQVVVVTTANVPNINFTTFVAMPRISGKVTNLTGTPLQGATVCFSTLSDATVNPTYTATTDASGNYSKGVEGNTKWYVAAKAAGYGPSADTTVNMLSSNVIDINFALVKGGDGLKGEYYDNTNFTSLMVTRTDPKIDFNWEGVAPDPSMGVTDFSVRWTGQIKPRYSETYTFYTHSDDGVRLWVNNVLLLENWTNHANTENSGTITLGANKWYSIKMEYFQGGGGAIISLDWESQSQPREVIPQSQLWSESQVVYTLSGKVSNSVNGLGISGATVYFSEVANPSANPMITATADVNGNWSLLVPIGTWYIAAGASTFNTSADLVKVVSTANITNVNFSLVPDAIISGKVTRSSDGTAISGAKVYFSNAANPSANPKFTATTDASGNYSMAVENGTWYIVAGASNYNTSADLIKVVTGTNLPNTNFSLVANSRMSGKVTKKSDGTAIFGATVYFSTSPDASVNPIFTTTTDASGNYSQLVQNGTWYVCASAINYNTSSDTIVVINGADVTNIDITLKSSVRNIPRTADLLFSVITDSLPASGAAGNWPTYIPSGSTLTSIGNPTVEVLGGTKWEKNNRMTSQDGFRFGGTYTSPIAVNGVTIVAAVKPTYCNPGGEARGEIVDIFYGDLFLAVGHTDGHVIVCRRNYAQSGTGYYVPEGQKTILSLVVSATGTLTLYANGVQKWTQASGVDYTTLQPGVDSYKHYINVGRNNPDGWSAFNGNIGDVFVYKVALSDAERQQLEADIGEKFVIALPLSTITASAGFGGSISPNGDVVVSSGADQAFTITPNPGYAVASVTVDGVFQGVVGSYTFTNVIANHTISATFAQIVQKVSQIKSKPDGAWVAITGPVVTATFDGFFYVEAPDRTMGIRVIWPVKPTVGHILEVRGSLETNADFERCLRATYVFDNGPGSCDPVGMAGRSLGCGNYSYNASTGAGQRGTKAWTWVQPVITEPPVHIFVDVSGLNNIGLLVRTWGRVTDRNNTLFFLDDMSNFDDGNPDVPGVKVLMPAGATSPQKGDFVVVTGISSCYKTSGEAFRLLLPMLGSDVRVIH